jgi:hypothetical protein
MSLSETRELTWQRGEMTAPPMPGSPDYIYRLNNEEEANALSKEAEGAAR